MSVDTTNDAATTMGDGGTQPEGATGASEQATATAEVPEQAADTSTESAAAESATPSSGEGSLTPPNTTSQNTENAKPAAPAVPWEKRYKDASSWGNKEHQERLKLQKEYESFKQQYSGLDPNDIKRWKQQQSEAERKNLPSWDKRNPAYGRFSASLTKYDAYRKAMSRAGSPEEKAIIQKTLGAEFNEQDISAIEGWENHLRDFQMSFAQDPQGTIGSIVQQEIQSAFDQYMRHQQADMAVSRDFESDLKPVLESEQYRDAFEQELRNGTPYQTAKRVVQLQMQLDALQSRVGSADKAKAAASEQQRLLKENAAVTRDSKPASTVDPVKVAKERGVQPGTPAYMDLLIELKEQNLL